MKLDKPDNRMSFLLRVENKIKKLRRGIGMTQIELAQHFGFNSADTAQNWVRQYPKLRDYIVYIHINGGRQRTAIFVNPQYRKELIKSGSATEIY